MSELGEGDCVIQCWICPKCNNDHSQNKECDTLEQWEKEATCTIPDCKCETDWNRKIKALIDLVRKKDEALSFAQCTIRSGETIGEDNPIRSALALTKDLK